MPSTNEKRLETYICNVERQQLCLQLGGLFADRSAIGRLNEYQVIGRHLPTETNSTPKLYRMRIFAPNTVVAKSRFWYFLMKLKKVKKSNGEVVSINQVRRPQAITSLHSRCIILSVCLSSDNALRFMRSARQRSKTSASGFATTPAQARTTCTKSTGKCLGRKLSMHYIRTWLRGIEQDSGQSTCV